MPSYKHLGKAATDIPVVWGAGTDFQNYGVLQRLTNTNNGTFADLKDENGQVVARTLYDSNDQLQAELVAKRTTFQNPPKQGDIVTIAGKKYICEGSVTTAENEKYAQFSLTITAYQGVVL